MENYMGLIIVLILSAIVVVNRQRLIGIYKRKIVEDSKRIESLTDVCESFKTDVKSQNVSIKEKNETINDITEQLNKVSEKHKELFKKSQNSEYTVKYQLLYISTMYQYMVELIAQYILKRKPSLIYSIGVSTKYILNNFTYFHIINDNLYKYVYINGIIWAIDEYKCYFVTINQRPTSFKDAILNKLIYSNMPKYWAFDTNDITLYLTDRIIFNNVLMKDNIVYNCSEAMDNTETVNINLLQFEIYHQLNTANEYIKNNFEYYKL